MSTTATETAAQEAAALEKEAQEAAERAQAGDAESKALSEESARKLQSENRAMRDRLKAAEAKVAEFEKQGLSDKERLERELAERDGKLTAAERELRSLRAQAVAAELGFIDPELAEPLLDWDKVGDSNDQKAIKAELREVLKRKPHLVRTRDGVEGGAGRGQRSGGTADMNDLIRAGTGRS
jgi:hypothetical protein